VGAAGAVWWRYLMPKPAWSPYLERLTADSGLTMQPAISPDGKLLAYVSDRGGAENLDIWVEYQRGTPIRITPDLYRKRPGRLGSRCRMLLVAGLLRIES
jgi:Tol biopolymer transport system component